MRSDYLGGRVIVAVMFLIVLGLPAWGALRLAQLSDYPFSVLAGALALFLGGLLCAAVMLSFREEALPY
jgi:hypothetical protein